MPREKERRLKIVTRAEAQRGILRLLVVTAGAQFFLDALDGLLPIVLLRGLRTVAGLVAVIAVVRSESHKFKAGG